MNKGESFVATAKAIHEIFEAKGLDQTERTSSLIGMTVTILFRMGIPKETIKDIFSDALERASELFKQGGMGWE